MKITTSRRLIAEGFGTFVLVLIGAGAVLTNSFSNGAVGVVGIALAHGFVILAMVYAFGAISGGHFNPAVTVAMWITNQLDSGLALLYIVSQLIGATIAGWLLHYILPLQAESLYNGLPMLAPQLSVAQGVVIEAIITFILVTVIFGVAVNPKSQSQNAGLAIGATITLLILFAGPLTGAAINPARAFGPALSSGQFVDQIVYWVGPLLGAAIAALGYKTLFLTKE